MFYFINYLYRKISYHREKSKALSVVEIDRFIDDRRNLMAVVPSEKRTNFERTCRKSWLRTQEMALNSITFIVRLTMLSFRAD